MVGALISASRRSLWTIPGIMSRTQVMHRGRVGQTNQARDMAGEGWLNLAKDIDRKAAGG